MQSNPPNAKAEKKVNWKKEAVKTVGIVIIIFSATFGSYAIMKASLGTTMPMVVVTSDSMVPEIKTGDLLFVKYVDPEDIKTGTHEDHLGDVIIYDSNGVWLSPMSDPIVHRVVGKYYNEEDGKYYFTTQGDANSDTDPPGRYPKADVPEDKVIGVVIGKVRGIGHVKIWLTNTGMAGPIMVILGFLLVISIVYDITHPEEESDDDKVEKGKKGNKREKSSGSMKPDNVDITLEKEEFDDKKIDFGV